MKSFERGDIIEHPVHGRGIVTFVGNDYVGVCFDNGGDVLLRRSSFERREEEEKPAHFMIEETEMQRADLPWPDSTFVFEGEGEQHYMGSHWVAFVDEVSVILQRFPEILPQALMQTGYGEHYPSPREIPADWPHGLIQTWPLRVNGIGLVERIDESNKQLLLVSFFPFYAEGSQTTLTLERVDVWEGGCEAQISATWGEAEITFFDTQYLLNRAWYEAGKRYDFILAGLAYNACPSTVFKMPVQQNPETLAWLSQLAAERGDEPPQEMNEINLTGMAMMLPIAAWDKDDYKFRAPIRKVGEFQDFLGQDGWRVRATVFRFGDENADLDIVITRRAWSGDQPPQVGQDIEGTLWLQGHLWCPQRR